MIIKELLLDGFGKFDRKYLKFERGINLVVANNEAGKTTVRKSIEAAFYGFTNTESKRKNYTEDYDNYKSGNYRVKVNLEEAGREISIERDLSNEIARVYENRSDRTAQYTFTNKVLTPGLDLLGVGSTVYKNFFDIESVMMMNNDLVDVLFNIENDTDYIKKILEKADKERAEIGSLNAPTKKRVVLNNKIIEKTEKFKEYDKVEEDIKILKSKVDEAENKKIVKKKKSITAEIVFLILFAIPLFLRTNYVILYSIPVIAMILTALRMFNKIKYNKSINTVDSDSERDFLLGQIYTLEGYLDKKIDDLDEINRMKAELKQLDYDYKILTDAINVIEEANKNIIDEPINNYTDKAKEIFKKITATEDLIIDRDFNTYLDRGFTLDFNQMSKSTKEIINFCLKIACRQFISDSGFIILDDAFQYLDDDRLENTINYIASISNDYQIIIFTSNSRIKNILDRNSSEYNLVDF